MTSNLVDVETLKNKYQRVLERTDLAAHRVGRSLDEIRVVVVTKTHPIEVVEAAVSAGIHCFGENYAEEAVPKIMALSDRPGVEWHMVGHVQSRKAKLVCEYFSYLHSLDSIKLANRLNRFAGDIGRKLPVLLECNVSGETSKSGFTAWQEYQWYELLPIIEQIIDLPYLKVCGLMTMPPFFTDPEESRPFFHRLYRLKDFLASKFHGVEWRELSMGMSNDFEVAVEEGATWVRIGNAILGPRG